MPVTTAAELQAILGVDTGNSAQQLSGFDRRLGGIGGTAGRIRKPLGRVDKGFRSIGRRALGFGTAAIALTGITTSADFLSDSIIGLNAELETSTLQFETLMGDAGKARKHVEGLFDFAKKTPFETGPIIQASKHLQTFGGDALNTKKNLTLIGDAAAAVGVQFDEVAFWTGRMYGNLQAGKPVGEAVTRLQEMGLITPKVRLKLEKMQEQGKSGAKIWEFLQGSMGRFTGSMEKQSKTWGGLTSTLTDTIQLTLAKGFTPLFEGMKSGLESVIAFLSDPAVAEAIAGIGMAVMQGIGMAVDFLAGVIDFLEPIISSIASLGEPVMEFFDLIMGGEASMDSLADAALGVVGGLANVGATIIDTVGPALAGLATDLAQGALDIAGWVLDGEDGLLADLTTWAGHITGAVDGLLDTLFGEGGTVGDLVDKLSGWVGDAIPKLEEKLPEVLTTITDWIGTNAPVIGENIGKFATEFVGWVITAGENIIPELANFLSTMVSWIANTGIPGAINAASGLAQGLIRGIMDGLSGAGAEVEVAPGIVIESGGGGGLADRLKTFFTDTIGPALVTVGETLVAEGLSLGGQLAKGMIEGMVNLPADLIAWFANDFPGLIGEAWESLTGEGENGGKAITDGVIDGLADLPSAFLDWVNNEAIPGIAEWLSTFNLEGAEGAKEFIAGFIDELPTLISDFSTWVTSDLIPGIAEKAADIAAEAKTWGEGFVDEFIKWVRFLPSKLWTWVTGTLVPYITDKLGPQLLTAGTDIAKDMLSGFIDVILGRKGHKGFFAATADLVNEIGRKLKSMALQLIRMGQDVAKNIWNALAGWWNRSNNPSLNWSFDLGEVGNVLATLGIVESRHVSGGVQLNFPDLPTYQHGAWNIPSNQLAWLHKGEAVFPASLASELREALRSGSMGGGAYVEVNIENFYGTEQNVRELSRELGRHVRTASVGRYSAGSRTG